MTSTTTQPMKNTDKNITLAQASEILGRPIIGHSLHTRIEWKTETHAIMLFENCDGVLCVQKNAKAWSFGSETRKGRSKSTSSFNPSAGYVKGLAV